MSNPDNFEERVVIARNAFAALVAADAWIALAPALPVITEEKGDITAMIAQALAKLGLCIVVVAAEADQLTRNGEGLSMRVRFAAQISEKVLFNKAAAAAAQSEYRPALACVMRVMKAVDRQPNGLDVSSHVSGLNEFELEADRPFELLKTPKDIVYEVSAFTTIEI